MEAPGEWEKWARGEREISGGEGPEIAFTGARFRRRLSLISRMTIQVLHDLDPGKDTKLLFLSFRGEVSRQLEINKTIIEEQSVLPAAFSLSVFNAPAALASIALGLTGGYCALFPGYGSFSAGIAAAAAELLCTESGEIAVAYADEALPPEYRALPVQAPPSQTPPVPLAFAAMLSRRSGPIALSGIQADSPGEFLRRLFLPGKGT
jgi:hypothetical protein